MIVTTLCRTGHQYVPILGLPSELLASSILAYLNMLSKNEKIQLGHWKPSAHRMFMPSTHLKSQNRISSRDSAPGAPSTEVVLDPVLFNKLSGTCLHRILLEVRLCGLQCEHQSLWC